MTRKRFIGFGLVAAGLLCLAFWYLVLANTMVVTNHSSVVAQRVVVRVCDEDYTLTDIHPNCSKSAFFRVTHKSGFDIRVFLGDGTSVTTNDGYIYGGEFGCHVEIEVTKDRKIGCH